MADVGGKSSDSSQSISSRVSRRRLFQVGVAGAAAGALSLHLPVVTLAKPLTTPERDAFAFVIGVLNSRCQAILDNSSQKLASMYDVANRNMLAFETDRVSRLHHMAHDQWHGAHAKVYSKVESFSIAPLQQSGTFEAKVRETLCFDWHYDPIPVPAYVEAERQRDPNLAARAAFSLANPDGTFPLRWGIDHVLNVARRSSGFIVLTHAYEELFLASPDAGGGQRSHPGYYGETSARSAPAAPAANQPDLAGDNPGPEICTGNITPLSMTNGLSYANTWKSSRNCSTYADWSPPRGGGDCANFVSQCLYAAGIATTSSWNRGNWGAHECKAGSGNWPNNYDGSSGGTYNWTANDRLRNWLLSSGTGSDASTNFPWSMYAGDVFNYDWTGDGVLDHTTYVVQTPTSTQPCYVDSHTADGQYLWNMGGAARYYGTHVFYPGGGGC